MKPQRKHKGSTIAETGPALLILFLIIFFPLLDLLGMTLSYTMCWYVNFKVSNQIARSRQFESGTNTPAYLSIANGVISDVLGFASFLKLTPNSITVPAPTYNPATSGTPATVVVSTSITAQPFITIPWFSPVPGLNAPLMFTISSQLPREVTL